MKTRAWALEMPSIFGSLFNNLCVQIIYLFFGSFFSIATIGLGDVMPNNLQYSPFLALLFLIGLALLSVVNSTVRNKPKNYQIN